MENQFSDEKSENANSQQSKSLWEKALELWKIRIDYQSGQRFILERPDESRKRPFFEKREGREERN